MANQLYGYNPSSTNTGIAARTAARSMDNYHLCTTDNNKTTTLQYGSSNYYGSTGYAFSSSPTVLYNQSDSSYTPTPVSRIPGQSLYGPPGVDVAIAAQPQPPVAAADNSYFSTLKRSSTDALYHQTLLGARNTIGQAEAWFSTNPLAKRPRFESASNLPIYPQRPGEKDCAHYMQTRTCKFGESCKFDHPIWVPEGGIPDWKEVPVTTESPPERPGEPDCPYFMKTQKCKFGNRCKFNHPKDNTAQLGATQNSDVSDLPERPSEPSCTFYMKTGTCKFGATCKFHHPRDIQVSSPKQENGSAGEPGSAINEMTQDVNLVKPLSVPALLHNSKGLPVRPGEVDCPFYLKTGSCKYGGTCRYNHPERNAAAIGSALVASSATHWNIGMVNPAASLLQSLDPRLTQTMLGLLPPVYPQRPGEIECDDRSTGQMMGAEQELQGLDYLTSSNSATTFPVVDSPNLIHRRLGHPSLFRLQKMVPILSSLSTLDCESCQLGKHICPTFSSSAESPAESVFPSVHYDIWGPSRVGSTLGFRFFVNFIDDHSRCIWILLMKDRYELSSIFKSFCVEIQNQFGNSVCTFHCDNALEYLSFQFPQFMTQEGIIH